MKYAYLFVLIIEVAFSQKYTTGDTVENFSMEVCANSDEDSLSFYSYNASNNGGTNKIIWINFFTSWWGSCQAEAPATESIFQQFKDKGLVVLGSGSDWGEPYTCNQWSNTFDLTYPLMDDSSYDLFFTFAWDGSNSPGNQYYVPMNIIYDHNMVIRYRSYGFREGAIRS